MSNDNAKNNFRYSGFNYNSSIYNTVPQIIPANRAFLNINFESASNGVQIRKRAGVDRLFDDADYSFPTDIADYIVGTQILISRKVLSLSGNFKGDPTSIVNNNSFTTVLSVWAYKKTSDPANIYSIAFSVNRKDSKKTLDYSGVTGNKIETFYANRRSVRVDIVGTKNISGAVSGLEFYININIEGTTLTRINGGVLYIAQPLLAITVLDYFSNLFNVSLVTDSGEADRYVSLEGLNLTTNLSPIRMFFANNRAFIVNGVRDSQQTFPNNSLPVSFFDSTINLSTPPKGKFFLKSDNNVIFLSESSGNLYIVSEQRIYFVSIDSTGSNIDVKEIANNIFSLKGGQISIGNELYTCAIDGIYKINLRQQVITLEDINSRISDSIFGLIKNLSPINTFFNLNNSTVNFAYKIRTDKGIFYELFSRIDNEYIDIVLSKKVQTNKNVEEQWLISTYEGDIFDVEDIVITGSLESVARADSEIRVSDFEFQTELAILTRSDCYLTNPNKLTDYINDLERNPYKIVYGINIPSQEAIYGYSGNKRTNFVSLKLYVEVEESFISDPNPKNLFYGIMYIVENKDGFESAKIIDSEIINYSPQMNKGLITLNVNYTNPNTVCLVVLDSTYIKSVIGHSCVVKNTKN